MFCLYLAQNFVHLPLFQVYFLMHVVFTFQVAKALIELFGEMVFVHGFVHGDPHPGNILVSPQGNGKFSLGTHFALKHGIFLLVYNHIASMSV